MKFKTQVLQSCFSRKRLSQSLQARMPPFPSLDLFIDPPSTGLGDTSISNMRESYFTSKSNPYIKYDRILLSGNPEDIRTMIQS